MTAGGFAAEKLRQFVERNERLEDEKREIQEQIRDVYNEAKAEGFDIKVMRQVIRLRRMKPHERGELEELLETYKAALGMV
ncbi:hypothetical protein HRbin39_00478 [bacterium HR39]|nr:hypothetical protein HRbin39_00478 [bacterium HR39]